MTQTPLTKEAVEREIRLLENNASDCHVRTETVAMLRELWGRVGELKADFEDAVLHLHSYKERVSELESDRRRLAHAGSEEFERGRLQGLNEALSVTIPSTSWGTEGLPQQYAEAIEALKGETTND